MINKDDFTDSVRLEALGDVESDGLACRRLKVSDERFDKVKVSFNDTKKEITGIKYYKGLRFVPFGEMNGNEEEWYFDDDNEPVGAHGYTKDGIFVNLGFVVHTTNETLCPVIEDGGD